MAIETRTTPDGYVDVKSPELNAWLRLTANARIKGGQDVKLSPEQSLILEQLNTNVAKLGELAKTAADNHQTTQFILTELRSAIAEINSINSTVDLAGDRINNVNTTVESIKTSILENTQAVQNSLQAQNSVLNTIRDIQQTLAVLTKIQEAIAEQSFPTQTYERVVNLAAAIEIAVPLPDKTRAFGFTCRKNTTGQTYDIRWSWVQGNIANGNYRTLWGGNEEYQEGVNLTGKTIYMWCEVAATAEIIAYY